MTRAHVERLTIPGAIGKLEAAINDPGEARNGIALVAHPHPLFGGSLDNKVAQTLAKAFQELGLVAIRINFRGVGLSEGAHDQGRGETDDWVKVYDWALSRYPDLPVVLAGFSFGGFVQIRVSQRVKAERLVLVAPAVGRLGDLGDFSDTGDVPGNTIVVHGDEDDVVPLEAVIDWAKLRQLPIILLPGAGHYFHGRLPQLKEIIQNACRS